MTVHKSNGEVGAGLGDGEQEHCSLTSAQPPHARRRPVFLTDHQFTGSAQGLQAEVENGQVSGCCEEGRVTYFKVLVLSEHVGLRDCRRGRALLQLER